MIQFDKMMIISDISNITDIDTNAFMTNIKDGEVLYYKYQQEQTFSLLIMANNKHNELVLEFTGKILADRYKELINCNTIRECLANINRLRICRLDVEAILSDGKVNKCDVTKDIPNADINRIRQTIKLNITSNRKWIVKEYNGGLTLEKVANTPRCKKRLTIYDKPRELQKSNNNEFLNSIHDKQRLLDSFANTVRFELNINTAEQIRRSLNIADNRLQSVLNATANPILSVIDEALTFAPAALRYQSLRDYERTLLIESCNRDLGKVEAKVRALSSSNTSIKKTMQPYRQLLQQMQGGEASADIRTILAV